MAMFHDWPVRGSRWVVFRRSGAADGRDAAAVHAEAEPQAGARPGDPGRVRRHVPVSDGGHQRRQGATGRRHATRAARWERLRGVLM